MVTQRGGLDWCQGIAGGRGGGKLYPGPLPQGCRAHFCSPEFSLEKEGFRTEARQVEGHGVWAQGEGTTLEGHPLSLMAHWVFRS